MSDRNSWKLRNLIGACAAITVFGFAFGLSYPLLSLILESRGVAPDMIGINAAMMPIGILLFSPIIPRAVRRFGSRKIAIAAAMATAILFIAYPCFDSLPAWFLIRLLQGMSISTLFVLSEAWIVDFAGNTHRGKVVAIYASVLSASFGAGPLLIGAIGIEGWLPFIIGAVVTVLGIIPLFLIQEEQSIRLEETGASGIFSFASKAPLLLACVGVFAIFDAATLSLIPVYGLANGLDLTTSANLLTVLIMGNAVLQLPIGWLSDRFAHRQVIMGCAFTTTVTLLLLPYVVGDPVMWPVLVVMGAAGYGVYTVSLASLGDRFSGIELVQGTSAFAIMWGIGALFGSISGGWAMTGFGPHGLPVSLAFGYFLLVAGIAIRRPVRHKTRV